jgi:hypothetical protein
VPEVASRQSLLCSLSRKISRRAQCRAFVQARRIECSRNSVCAVCFQRAAL